MKEPKHLPSKPAENTGNFFNSLDWKANMVEGDNKSVHSSPHESNSPDSQRGTNNSNEQIFDLNEPENSEAIGNLLGDFEANDDSETYSEINHKVPENDVDGLVDFFSAFPTSSTKSEVPYPEVKNDIDLFNDMGGTTETNDVNLLFFDSSTTEKSSNLLFDPFGHNLVNSSSSKDITSNDWMNSSTVFPQAAQSSMKSSNSTHSLLNMTNQIKPSPSFNAQHQTQPKTFGSDFNIFDNASKDKSVNNKPVPPPKPQMDKKSGGQFETVPPKKPNDAFKDLLGDFKPNDGSTNGPRTIRDIRKEKLSKTRDPETMKVFYWFN